MSLAVGMCAGPEAIYTLLLLFGVMTGMKTMLSEAQKYRQLALRPKCDAVELVREPVTDLS